MGGLGYLDEEDTQFAADLGETDRFAEQTQLSNAEYSSSTLLRRYIRLPGSIDETFLMIDVANGNAETWAYTDRIGSVVATDGGGADLGKYRYSPYGKTGAEGSNGARGPA